ALEGAGHVHVAGAVHRDAGPEVVIGAAEALGPGDGAVGAVLGDEDVAGAGAGEGDRAKGGGRREVAGDEGVAGIVRGDGEAVVGIDVPARVLRPLMVAAHTHAGKGVRPGGGALGGLVARIVDGGDVVVVVGRRRQARIEVHARRGRHLGHVGALAVDLV